MEGYRWALLFLRRVIFPYALNTKNVKNFNKKSQLTKTELFIIKPSYSHEKFNFNFEFLIFVWTASSISQTIVKNAFWLCSAPWVKSRQTLQSTHFNLQMIKNLKSIGAIHKRRTHIFEHFWPLHPHLSKNVHFWLPL